MSTHMTSRIRREQTSTEPSLTTIAATAPMTGRGFAASKGVRLERAMTTGSTAKVAGRYSWSNTCTAETFCDTPCRSGYQWCERHAARAETLGHAGPAAL